VRTTPKSAECRCVRARTYCPSDAIRASICGIRIQSALRPINCACQAPTLVRRNRVLRRQQHDRLKLLVREIAAIRPDHRADLLARLAPATIKQGICSHRGLTRLAVAHDEHHNRLLRITTCRHHHVDLCSDPSDSEVRAALSRIRCAGFVRPLTSPLETLLLPPQPARISKEVFCLQTGVSFDRILKTPMRVCQHVGGLS
jgi:hypothetical protein